MIHPATYDDCKGAVERAFGLFPIDVAGKKVMVKPNVLRASKSEDGVVTHPAVLRAVIDCLEKLHPASIVVGDNPGLFSYGSNEAAFEQAGLLDAAKGYYRNIGNESIEMNVDSIFVDRLGASREIMEADIFISLPKFKTHGLTVVTGAIKNSYGILPGAQKAVLHRKAGNPERFHEVVVDVFQLRVPDLFIVDAVVGMEGNGPASPDLRSINRIMASKNGVALDATISRMMGLEPGKLRFIQIAAERGLGDYGTESIDMIGELETIPNFKLPPLGGEAVADSKVIQDLIYSRTLLRPEADPTLCTACETCVDQCPVSALTMADNLPVVDPDVCIMCFCCQEICPEKAIVLQ
jgi:uncharacterized protein (DUF362 family)/NAD-dependent dihydropyrimidine dehydrogenase PreA subunit